MARARAIGLLGLCFIGCGGQTDGSAGPLPITRAIQHSEGDAVASEELPPPRDDGRLPPLAIPTRYSLDLNVDPNQARFSGVVKIDVVLPKPTRYVVLHARDIHVVRANATRLCEKCTGGHSIVDATTAMRVAHGGTTPEELVLTFARPLDVGDKTTIEIAYDAPFADSLSGLYRVQDEARWYAFTQFESTDARRAFPCFDEPGFKTSYQVAVTVPRGMLAVANAPETRHTESPAGTRFQFDPTPPLPSYLVALAVGDLDVREGPKSPVPVRLVSAKGKSRLGALAIDATAALVDKLGEYFGVPYPYAKLDVVAVPDFAAGAMENPGLVTFREELLLLDPQRASTRSRRSQGLVIAHELAHQWFGDLVTMQWWNDLWLNEGFATWMEARVVDRWQPSFGARVEEVASTQYVMDTDALRSARAVRQPVATTGEAMEAFDGITYQKGAAVLAMTEAWVGEKTFQDGVRAYIHDHAWQNAKAEDLLVALEKASGKKVSAMAATFLDKAGVPNVVAHLACEAKGRWHVDLQQETWRPLGAGDDKDVKDAAWTIPVCVRAEGVKAPLCAELGAAPGIVAGTGACPAWIHPNAEERGYYRFTLAEPEMTALVKAAAAGALDVRAAIGVLSNLWAQVRAGNVDPAFALKVLPAFDKTTERMVVDQVTAMLAGMSDALVGDEARPAFRAYVKARMAAHKKALGWGETGKAKGAGGAAGEAEDRALMRRAVLTALGELAEDDETLREAKGFAERWVADPASVDPDTANIATELASRRGDAAWFDALLRVARGAKEPQDRVTALRALAGFGDPRLVEKALDLVLTPDVKVQDIRYVFGSTMAHRASRPIATAWLKAHWEPMRAKLAGPLASRLVRVAAAQCTAAERDDVAAFLKPRATDIEGAARPLTESLEEATLCVELRKRGAAKTTAFFVPGTAKTRRE